MLVCAGACELKNFELLGPVRGLGLGFKMF